MIVDATLIDDVELSHDSLDAVLGEAVTDMIMCRMYYQFHDVVKPGLSIQTSMKLNMSSRKSLMKTLHYVSK